MVNIKHPHSNYTLGDACKLAVRLCKTAGQAQPKTLNDARTIVRRKCDGTPHVWLTGMVAMDVLDAAIDGINLRKHSRLLGTVE